MCTWYERGNERIHQNLGELQDEVWEDKKDPFLAPMKVR